MNPVDELEKPKEAKSLPFLSEGLLIVIVTAATYLGVFQYEKGCCRAFGIPSRLISIEVLSSLVLSGEIFAIIGMMIGLFYGVRPFLEKKHWSVVFLIPLFVVLAIWTKSWAYIIMGLIVSPLVMVKKWEPKYLIANKGSSFFTLFFILTIGGMILEDMGRAKAKRTQYFLVTNDPQPKVVLRIYGDRIICANFDINSKKVESVFTVLNVEDPTRTLSLQKIGPLKADSAIEYGPEF